jgi:hypothetical protein
MALPVDPYTEHPTLLDLSIPKSMDNRLCK